MRTHTYSPKSTNSAKSPSTLTRISLSLPPPRSFLPCPSIPFLSLSCPPTICHPRPSPRTPSANDCDAASSIYMSGPIQGHMQTHELQEVVGETCCCCGKGIAARLQLLLEQCALARSITLPHIMLNMQRLTFSPVCHPEPRFQGDST
jgi:hypothetical protein